MVLTGQGHMADIVNLQEIMVFSERFTACYRWNLFIFSVFDYINSSVYDASISKFPSPYRRSFPGSEFDEFEADPVTELEFNVQGNSWYRRIILISSQIQSISVFHKTTQKVGVAYTKTLIKRSTLS